MPAGADGADGTGALPRAPCLCSPRCAASCAHACGVHTPRRAPRLACVVLASGLRAPCAPADLLRACGLTRCLPCLQGLGVWAVVCAPSQQESRWGTTVAGAALSEACAWLGEELRPLLHAGRQEHEDHAAHASLAAELGSLALTAASTFFLLAGALGWRRWIDGGPRRGGRLAAGMWVMVSVAVFWGLAAYSCLASTPHATPVQEFLHSAFACFSDAPPDYCADWGLSDSERPAWPHLASPHEVLGCDEWGSVQECKRLYKALALALHPDKCLACRSRARAVRCAASCACCARGLVSSVCVICARGLVSRVCVTAVARAWCRTTVYAPVVYAPVDSRAHAVAGGRLASVEALKRA